MAFAAVIVPRRAGGRRRSPRYGVWRVTLPTEGQAWGAAAG